MFGGGGGGGSHVSFPNFNQPEFWMIMRSLNSNTVVQLLIELDVHIAQKCDLSHRHPNSFIYKQHLLPPCLFSKL